MRLFVLAVLLVVSPGCVQDEGGFDDDPEATPTPTSGTAGTTGTMGESPPSGRLASDTIDQGDDSGHQTDEFVGLVVTDEGSWVDLWDSHSQQRSPPPERPYVDFEQLVVLAVFMGERPTTGYGIEIGNVSFTADTYHVQYIETSPGPGCLVGQAITYPFHLVTVDRIDWDDEPSVDFTRHQRADCPDNGTLVT